MADCNTEHRIPYHPKYAIIFGIAFPVESLSDLLSPQRAEQTKAAKSEDQWLHVAYHHVQHGKLR